MRDYDPEANKEVGASPKADSQAGDEQDGLREDIKYIFNGGKPEPGQITITKVSDKGLDGIMKLVDAYAERRATRRAVEELNALRDQTRQVTAPEAFVTDQNVAQGIRAHTNSLIEHRLIELEATLTKEIQSS